MQNGFADGVLGSSPQGEVKVWMWKKKVWDWKKNVSKNLSKKVWVWKKNLSKKKVWVWGWKKNVWVAVWCELQSQ